MTKTFKALLLGLLLTSQAFAGDTLVKRWPSDTPVKVAPLSGSLTSGHCVKSDASGNIVDAGAACGSGGTGGTIAIGSAVSGGTSGSVLFIDSSGFLAQNNSNLFWNDSTTGFTAGNLTLNTQATKTAHYNLTTSDNLIYADATNATGLTVRLPTASGVTGRQYSVKRVSTGATQVTVSTLGAETVDAATSVTLTLQYASLDFVSDGSNWRIE